jgi:adenylyltransferase/sulfurtransferase
MTDLGLDESQITRYSRHILLKDVGVQGQKKLLEASVFVVGAGGLGSPALYYLAAAGVGRIGIVDSDVVDLSNLQRQILFGVDDVGKNKAKAAADAIRRLNPDCEVETSGERLTSGNIEDVCAGYDVILDGSDNFPTRFLVNDFCWLHSVPLVSAAVVQFDGQLLTVVPEAKSPCYRCMLPQPPEPGTVPSCQEAGVLGAVAGVMGTLQATEALKLILGIGELYTKSLLVYSALDGKLRLFNRSSDPDCPLCGSDPRINSLEDYEQTCSFQEVE